MYDLPPKVSLKYTVDSTMEKAKRTQITSLKRPIFTINLLQSVSSFIMPIIVLGKTPLTHNTCLYIHRPSAWFALIGRPIVSQS